MQRARLYPTIKQKSILGAIWFVSALYGLTFCLQDKVNKISKMYSLQNKLLTLISRSTKHL